MVCLGFLQVPQFPPTVQKHATRCKSESEWCHVGLVNCAGCIPCPRPLSTSWIPKTERNTQKWMDTIVLQYICFTWTSIKASFSILESNIREKVRFFHLHHCWFWPFTKMYSIKDLKISTVVYSTVEVNTHSARTSSSWPELFILHSRQTQISKPSTNNFSGTTWEKSSAPVPRTMCKNSQTRVARTTWLYSLLTALRASENKLLYTCRVYLGL